MWSEPIDLESLCAIFDFERHADLRKHCRKITIHGGDLAKLIMVANVSDDLCHLPVFRHHHPKHLALSEDNLKSMGMARVGEEPPEGARKAFKKAFQMFDERRMFCGHLFWFVEDPDELPTSWQLFYFDDKDISDHRNHWQHGRHLHLMNHLTHPNLPLKDLLDKLEMENRPDLGGGLYIRFNP